MDKEMILWGLGGALVFGGVAFALSKNGSLTNPGSVSEDPLDQDGQTGQQGQHFYAGESNVPGQILYDDEWKAATLASMKSQLDALGAPALDDQYWRAVRFITSRDPAFVVPSSLDQYRAIDLLSQRVSALAGAGRLDWRMIT